MRKSTRLTSFKTARVSGLTFLVPLAWAGVTCMFWGLEYSQGVPAPLLGVTLVAAGIYFFYIPPWPICGVSVRNVLALAYTLVAVVLLNTAIRIPSGSGGSLGIAALLALFGFTPLRLFFASVATPRSGINLTFPLVGGRFAVLQGGNSPIINQHFRSTTQRHALDVVALARFGMRGRKLFPERNEDYVAFGALVTAPCEGTVVGVQCNVPDVGNVGLSGKAAIGNFIVLRHDDGTLVVLAHLQEGSVKVQIGDRVASGTLLGRIGNSGRSTEPHLHIHAERDGAGVLMRFSGRDLVRNAVVTVS